MRVPLSIRAIPVLTFRAWLTPPPIGPSTRERDAAAMADFDEDGAAHVRFQSLGEGQVALLLHGWGGRPAQMAPMARRLALEGFRAVVPDLPGRAGGGPTDIIQVAAAVREVTEAVGMPSLVVAHSFAGLVLRLAFPDEVPERVVLVAPVLDVHDALDVFGDRLRLLPWARRGLRRRLEAWNPALWPRVSRVDTDHLGGADVLVLHDPDDEETPFARSATLAALRPGTELVPVRDVGHSKILASPDSLDALTHFLTAARAA